MQFDLNCHFGCWFSGNYSNISWKWKRKPCRAGRWKIN